MKLLNLTKIKSSLTREGQTSEEYKQRAESYCKLTERVAIAACIVGLICILKFWWFNNMESALRNLFASIGR